jgi:hypothetical protein
VTVSLSVGSAPVAAAVAENIPNVYTMRSSAKRGRSDKLPGGKQEDAARVDAAPVTVHTLAQVIS